MLWWKRWIRRYESFTVPVADDDAYAKHVPTCFHRSRATPHRQHNLMIWFEIFFIYYDFCFPFSSSAGDPPNVFNSLLFILIIFKFLSFFKKTSPSFACAMFLFVAKYCLCVFCWNEPSKLITDWLYYVISEFRQIGQTVIWVLKHERDRDIKVWGGASGREDSIK